MAVEHIRRQGGSSSLAQDTLVKNASNVIEIAAWLKDGFLMKLKDSSNDVLEYLRYLKVPYLTYFILFALLRTGTAVAVVILTLP